MKSLIRNDFGGAVADFVFEEIAGRGPTFASKYALETLGVGHYLDIDPVPERREEHGIPRVCSTNCVWDPMLEAEVPDDIWRFNIVGHRKREEYWVKQIQATSFKRAVVLCGIGHLFSFAYRLESLGFSVEAEAYTPHHRVCRRQHVRGLPEPRKTQNPLNF